jgi:hypothetical protein
MEAGAIIFLSRSPRQQAKMINIDRLINNMDKPLVNARSEYPKFAEKQRELMKNY